MIHTILITITMPRYCIYLIYHLEAHSFAFGLVKKLFRLSGTAETIPPLCESLNSKMYKLLTLRLCREDILIVILGLLIFGAL